MPQADPKPRATLIAVFLLAILVYSSAGHAQEASPRGQSLEWQLVQGGLWRATYVLSDSAVGIRSPVSILRVDPATYRIEAVVSSSLGRPLSPISSMVNQTDAIAGINANFFDPDGKALGLVIRNGKRVNPLHLGGSTLTGVFFVQSNNGVGISHRSKFRPGNIREAIQSGPRLVAKGRALKLRSPHTHSRRSGVAITSTGHVLLYATLSRFPGASLHQIQQMLLGPELGVRDALNLDGGGSSQLYLSSSDDSTPQVDTSGGDDVPVGLVVRARTRK